MKFMKFIITALAVGLSFTACSSSDDTASRTKDVEDIVSMQKRSDGNFDVVCRDGSREVASPTMIRQNQICGNGGGGGGEGACWAENGYFYVLDDGRTLNVSIDSDLATPMVACGTSVAAVYDGDYLRIYDFLRKRFDYASVDDAYSQALVAVDGGVAALYDGDYLHVYDVTAGRFDYTSVDDNAPHARLLVTSTGLLFYDDDYVHSWCARNRRFDYESADDNQSSVRAYANGTRLNMVVNGDVFALDTTTCTLSN